MKPPHSALPGDNRATWATAFEAAQLIKPPACGWCLTPLQFCSDRPSALPWEDLPIGQDGSFLNAASQGAVFGSGLPGPGAPFGRFR